MKQRLLGACDGLLGLLHRSSASGGGGGGGLAASGSTALPRRLPGALLLHGHFHIAFIVCMYPCLSQIHGSFVLHGLGLARQTLLDL
jgi:hypothetical protein